MQNTQVLLLCQEKMVVVSPLYKSLMDRALTKNVGEPSSISSSAWGDKTCICCLSREYPDSEVIGSSRVGQCQCFLLKLFHLAEKNARFIGLGASTGARVSMTQAKYLQHSLGRVEVIGFGSYYKHPFSSLQSLEQGLESKSFPRVGESCAASCPFCLTKWILIFFFSCKME